MKNYGGFWVRFFAGLLDGIIIGIPLSILISVVLGVENEQVVDVLYDIFFGTYNLILPLVWDGYVIGKRIMGIQIQRMDGESLTFTNIFIREIVGKTLILLVTFGLTAIVSAFMVAFRKDKRAIHDLMAGTCIVKY